jgi:hypothetical protein
MAMLLNALQRINPVFDGWPQFGLVLLGEGVIVNHREVPL